MISVIADASEPTPQWISRSHILNRDIRVSCSIVGQLGVLFLNCIPEGRRPGTPTKRPPTKRPRLQNVLSTKRPSKKRPSTERPIYKTSLHSKRPRLQNVPPTKRPSLKTSSPTKRPCLQNVLPQNVLPFVIPQNVLF